MSLWIEVLGGWYEYAIDELDGLLRRCPEDRWLQNVWEVKSSDGGDGACWQVASHTVIALDAYLSPSLPFAPLMAFEDWDGSPAAPYRRSDVLEYLALCRKKARETFASLTEEMAAEIRGDEPFASALVRGVMHLREHTGQLGVFIGAGPDSP